MAGLREVEGVGTEKSRSHQWEWEGNLKADGAVHAAVPGFGVIYFTYLADTGKEIGFRR